MEINPLIFRAYDIRGIAEGDSVDLSPEAMYAIGRGFGTYMQRKSGDKQSHRRGGAGGAKGAQKFVVGKDNRTHGKILHESFIAGLLSTGCDVLHVELASSPMIYWASCVLNVDGGVNITASHNPKEYNGVKLVGKNAHSICGDELQEILKLIQQDDFIEGNGQGRLESVDIFPEYLTDIKKRVEMAKKLKIVIDAGNGITGKFAPELFRALGCDVVELYCELDGTFPNHEANPEAEENMEELKKRVVAEGADLGLAFDGDGDRVGVIDEGGKFYAADLLLIPLARDLLSRNPGAKIIFDTKTSKIIENDIRAGGGVPVRYKTGHSFIETKMRESGALLAGETSGHLFFAENWYGFDDGMYAGARLVQLVSKSEKPYSSFYEGLPQVHNTPELKIPCSDSSKFRVVEDVKEYFVKRYPCLTIDGVWIDFGNDAWGAVRASNTSPYLTLRFEAGDETTLQRCREIVVTKLKEYPEVDLRKV
ncbi:phosphomannomutase [Candidatus Peregrinibacteria bacterium CG11_big_fil_rev_8_21_14_0_20_46_8]|nr:MAG: phosphomannomutase [Candidatus Peregrinibacteria bacterium CG11_big_fil_rev_8_21_14_0_20_46_8]